MASFVGICNVALQKLGEPRITSLSQDIKAAREMSVCYEAVRDALLRAYPWSFAIKRVALAADVDVPVGDEFDNQFTLPADCLRVLPPNDRMLDWTIEGNKLLTNYDAPLHIRYIGRVEDPNLFDTCFVQLYACDLAVQTCESITQSNTKLQSVKDERRLWLSEARRSGAIEKISSEPPEDDWLAARR